jgi:ABC-type antimicrobial peptide transport system permease subunit
MALGAQENHVLGLVITQGLRLTIVGVLIGLFGAFALTRYLSSQLFRVRPDDPFTFAVIPLVLAAVALVACWLPARRAAHVNPTEALRHE